MKKVLGLLVVIVIVAGVVPYARGLGTPAPPQGVAASDWIPFCDSAGFVVTHETQWSGAAPRTDAVQGYFVVHRAAGWRRVEGSAQPDARPVGMR